MQLGTKMTRRAVVYFIYNIGLITKTHHVASHYSLHTPWLEIKYLYLHLSIVQSFGNYPITKSGSNI